MKHLILFTFVFLSLQIYSQKKYFKAIDDNNLLLFNKLLNRGEDFNYQRDNDLYTPLIYAAKLGKVDFVDVLIEKNANLEIKDKYGNTALLRALSNGDINIAEKLISNGAKLNVKNKNGLSCLHAVSAIEPQKNKGNFESQMNIIHKIMADGISVNDTTNNGNTPLIYAVKGGNLDIVKFYINNGADIHKKAKNGRNAVGNSIYYDHPEIFRFLVEKGADINATCQYNYTPLIIAIKDGHFSLAKELLELGAEASYTSPSGASALKYAIIHNNMALTDTILTLTQPILDLGDDVDNELLYQSVVNGTENSIFDLLKIREKNYLLAMENKELALKYPKDSDKYIEYIYKADTYLIASLNSFSMREKEYRKISRNIQLGNVMAVSGTVVQAAAASATGTGSISNPANKMHDASTYKNLAESYKVQMEKIKKMIIIKSYDTTK